MHTRLVLLALSFLLAGAANAKPCKKLVVDETDAFGKRVHGGVVYVDYHNYLSVGLREEGGKMLLESMWARRGVIESVAPAGTEVHLAFEGGEVFSAKTAEQADPVSNANIGGVYTQWKLAIEVDPDTLAKLGTTATVALRSEWGGTPLTFELPTKKQKDFMTVAQCMQQ